MAARKVRNKPVMKVKPKLGSRGPKLLSAGLSPGTNQKPGHRKSPVYHEGSPRGPVNDKVQPPPPSLARAGDELWNGHIPIPGVNQHEEKERKRERRLRRLERELRENTREQNGGMLV